MTLAQLIALLPTVIEGVDDVVKLLEGIRAAAAAKGLADENALLDAAIADAHARHAREA